MNTGRHLESEIPIVPKSAPYKLRPVFDGAHDEKCSVDYFRDFLPDSEGCKEIAPENQGAFQLRTFWHPEEAPFCSQPHLSSIQQKIKAFLSSLENFMPNYWGMTALVQFWAPITTKDGKRTLSISKQPFAVRENLKGLCRYRYYCIECCRIGNRKEVGTDFGPVGRAFNRGSLEFSPHVYIYSDKDFPFKNHAKHCGVAGYLALPLFELGNTDTYGQQPSCVGVLEFISLTKNILSSFDTRICMKKLKDVGLAFRYPSHSEAFSQIRPCFNFLPPGDASKGKPDELTTVLDLVRKAYSLPLIQVWTPCICDGSEVSVACETISDSFSKVTHLFCGLKCLDQDETRSVWLSSYVCCDSQVYFVEDGESWVGRAHSLKKICFIKDIRQFSIADYPLVTLGHSSDLLPCFAVPLQLVNPKLPPLVLELFLPTQYSFDADQGAVLKPILYMVAQELSKYNADVRLGHDEECSIEIFHSNDNYDGVYDKTPTKAKPWLTYVRRKDQSAYVQHQHYQPNDATESSAVGQSNCLKKRGRPSCQGSNVHPAQQTPELPTESVNLSDEDQQSGMRCSPIDKEVDPATILIPVENPVAKKVRVASIGHRNNEVNYGASIPSTNGKGKNTELENDEVGHGTSIRTNGKSRSTIPENDEVDPSCSMIVKARYNDDIVRFPFSSSSGIEGLRRDLLKRFELEVGRFKIKYPEDGDWIMLSCSEDLSFHMRALVSSGETMFDLSVFPTT